MTLLLRSGSLLALLVLIGLDDSHAGLQGGHARAGSSTFVIMSGTVDVTVCIPPHVPKDSSRRNQPDAGKTPNGDQSVPASHGAKGQQARRLCVLLTRRCCI